MNDLATSLRKVLEDIEQSCRRAGRRPNEVSLVAVSKAKPIEDIRAVFTAGQTIFGENYVQEALLKVESLPMAEWHFIGHLQTNKVRLICGRFRLIHSVDRLKLIDELARTALAAGLVQDILLQIRIGDEITKRGAGRDEVSGLVERILEFPSLRLRGLMSLPPLAEDEKTGRGHFSQLRSVFEEVRDRMLTPSQARSFTELSMGTSADYRWAILEGATLVRVGTAIFGGRPPREPSRRPPGAAEKPAERIE